MGFHEGLLAAQQELVTLLEEYELLKRQEERVMLLVETVVNLIPGGQRLLEIKDMGIISASISEPDLAHHG